MANQASPSVNQYESVPKSALYQSSNLHFTSDRDGKGEVKVLPRMKLQDVSGHFIKLRKKDNKGNDRYAIVMTFEEAEENVMVMIGSKAVDEGLIAIKSDDKLHFIAEQCGYEPNEDKTKEGHFFVEAEIEEEVGA